MRLSEEMRALDPESVIEHFRDAINTAATPLEVIGVKEIRHEGVSRVSRSFPDMRVIVTMRDPRDIYLLMYHKRHQLRRRSVSWTDPNALADDSLI